MCRIGQLLGSVLPVQVQIELPQEIQEGGLGHPYFLQSLLVTAGLLGDVKPPVLAGSVGPNVVGQETQDCKCRPSGGILEPIISVLAVIWPGGWGLGGRCAAVVALGHHTKPRQVLAAHGELARPRYPWVSWQSA